MQPFAHPAVQRDERDVGLFLAERDIDVAVDVDRHDLVAALAQCRDHRFASAQGHLALARQPSEQNSDLLRLHRTAPLHDKTLHDPARISNVRAAV